MELMKGDFRPRIKRTMLGIVKNAIESPIHLFSPKGLDKWPIQHLVFVCKGNVCRSVFAEYYLKAITPGQGLRIESRGLEVGKSTASPYEAVLVSMEFGLDLSAHRSKALASCDLQSAELIVAMEYGQAARMKGLAPECKDKICVLRDFAPFPERLFCNIYDPYGLEEDEFRRCFQQIKRALDGLRDHLERKSLCS